MPIVPISAIMPRRRRRAAPDRPPVYAEVARHYKETSVLKPVSATTHPDDWPCFLLSDATVHARDGNLFNQLEVDMFGPFIVRGKLEIEKDNQRYRTSAWASCHLLAFHSASSTLTNMPSVQL